MRIQFIFLLLLVVGVSSCSSQPKFKTNYQRSYDFSAIESYSLYERNSAFSDFQNISDATRNSIEIAIEKGFDSLGLVYKRPSKADVIIGYHIINVPRELKAYDRSVRYCRVCLPEQAGSSTNNKWRNTPGSLIVDVISRETKRTVWRGVSPLKIKDKDNSSDIHQKLQQAITVMLETLPRNEI